MKCLELSNKEIRIYGGAPADAFDRSDPEIGLEGDGM